MIAESMWLATLDAGRPSVAGSRTAAGGSCRRPERAVARVEGAGPAIGCEGGVPVLAPGGEVAEQRPGDEVTWLAAGGFGQRGTRGAVAAEASPGRRLEVESGKRLVVQLERAAGLLERLSGLAGSQ